MLSMEELVEVHRAKEAAIFQHPKLIQKMTELPETLKALKQEGAFLHNASEEVSLILQKYPIFVSLHPRPHPTDRDHMHNHTYFELVYVYRGTCYNRFWKNQNELILHENDMLLLNPHTPHALYTLTDEDCVFNILIKSETYEKIMLQLLGGTALFSNVIFESFYQIEKALEYLYLKADEKFPVQHYVQLLANETLSQTEFSESMAEHLTALLLIQLTRSYYFQHQDFFAGSQHQSIGKILSYLFDHAATVSLKGLSQQFGYSTVHISRLLKQATGKSYAEILREFRLKKAKTLLETTSLSISEIAIDIGCDQATFYQRFKSQYGLTPAEYRKRNRLPE